MFLKSPKTSKFGGKGKGSLQGRVRQMLLEIKKERNLLVNIVQEMAMMKTTFINYIHN